MMQMPFNGGSYPGMPSPLQGLATPPAQQRATIGVPGGRLPYPGMPSPQPGPPPVPAAPQPPQPQYGWGNPEQSWGAPPQPPAAGPQLGPAPEAPLMPAGPIGKKKAGYLPDGRRDPNYPTRYGPAYDRRNSPGSPPPSQGPRGGQRDVEFAFNNKGSWQYQDPQEAARRAIDESRGAGWSGNSHPGSQRAYNAAVKNNWLSPESMDRLRGMTPSNRQAWLMNSGVFNSREVNDIARRLNAKKGRRR